MTFERKTWQNNPPSSTTPITAEELNRMEAGIDHIHGREYVKGAFPNGVDLNTFYTPGVWRVSSGFVPANLPTTGSPGTAGFIIVGNSKPPGSWAFQEYLQYGPTNHRLWRVSTNGSGGWGPWHKVPKGEEIENRLDNLDDLVERADWVKGRLPFDIDLNNFLEPGVWRINAGRGTINLPPVKDPNPAGFLTVTNLYEDNNVWGVQEYIQYGAQPERFWRISQNTTGLWGPWQKVKEDTGEDPSGVPTVVAAGTPNEMRIQKFKEDYPLTSTGNKGAVVIRYDHGVNNLYETFFAMHQTHNIPFMLTMNSRTWDRPEHNRSSPERVKEMIASGLCEVTNHTATHVGTEDPAEVFDIIVNGRKELEDMFDIPLIHGFVIPGMGGTWTGFQSGTLDQYSDTLAGALILANHAVTSGVIGPTHRVLDGVIRQGGRHITIDSGNIETTKAHIDQAANEKKALTLMIHPSLMDRPEYYPSTFVDEVLQYIRTKIDAGELANISYYQSLHATL